MLLDDLIGIDLVGRLASAPGRDGVKDWIRDTTPKKIQMKRGDFGEVLAAALMNEFHGLELPIKKQRYRV